MKLFLQMGHGMRPCALELIAKWKEGTAIISPRDMNYNAIKKFAQEVKAINGKVLFDPQFYLPRADHEGLLNHSYWPKDYSTQEFTDTNLTTMINEIWKNYNKEIGTDAFILPGCYAEEITDSWFEYQEKIIDISKAIDTDRPIFATIALSEAVLNTEDQLHTLLARVEEWSIDGFYVIADHTSNPYLVDNPNWLANLMDLTVGMKLLGKTVIVGYCNHQNICLALSKVDAIASGTFLNVRKFSLSKFRASDEDSISRRSVWYYSPQTLSEFQLQFLDLAHRQKILDILKVDPSFDSTFSEVLFSGAKPTDTAFSEKPAFRHYLQCLKLQVEQASRNSYEETYDGLIIQLATAEKILSELKKKGIRGKYRDFGDIIDVNTGALAFFNNIRGFALKQNW